MTIDYNDVARDLHCCEASMCDGYERIRSALEAAEERGYSRRLREEAEELRERASDKEFKADIHDPEVGARRRE